MTGHLSVIYTVECQINFVLRLLSPIIKSLPSYRAHSLVPPILSPSPATVEVCPEAAQRDFEWTQREAKKLVWASGCTNWAIDPKTGLNNMMYPDWQFMFWWRSVFWRKEDFVYRDEKTGREVKPGRARRLMLNTVMFSALLGVFWGRGWFQEELPRWFRGFDGRAVVRAFTASTA